MIISILMLLIFILCSFYVFYPLFDNTKEMDHHINEDKRALELYKQNLIKQIEDVKFEREMGTISEEDYISSKNDLLLESTKYFIDSNNIKQKKEDE